MEMKRVSSKNRWRWDCGAARKKKKTQGETRNRSRRSTRGKERKRHDNDSNEQRCRDKTERTIIRGRTQKSGSHVRFKRDEMRKSETRKKNKNG